MGRKHSSTSERENSRVWDREREGREREREEGYAHGKSWSRARTPLVFAFCRQREGTGALVFFFPGGNNRKREEVDKRARANSLEAL